jgi:hypothetical protein
VRNKNGQTVQTATPENANVFEVSEVIQGGTYTYMKVKENMDEKWVATAKKEINSGDVLYYDNQLQMTNFHSKELDRTFDEIYFINQVSENPIQNNPMAQMPDGHDNSHDQGHSGKVETEKESSITMEKSGNEITIGQVFDNPDNFSGKEIEIRGVVVKVNKNIMGKNWVHIQDGTSSNGKFDLTITTQDAAEVNEQVTFNGKITLEKDFGAGYYYDVIMEDAVLASKNQATTTQL